mmetsp:Transcript_28270/g.33510  ORF Transcript_28270/g.33510 Transcript_28270/m.33510 type:complete len:301 (-) Transcript_28270:186-1088(-)
MMRIQCFIGYALSMFFFTNATEFCEVIEEYITSRHNCSCVDESEYGGTVTCVESVVYNDEFDDGSTTAEVEGVFAFNPCASPMSVSLYAEASVDGYSASIEETYYAGETEEFTILEYWGIYWMLAVHVEGDIEAATVELGFDLCYGDVCGEDLTWLGVDAPLWFVTDEIDFGDHCDTDYSIVDPEVEFDLTDDSSSSSSKSNTILGASVSLVIIFSMLLIVGFCCSFGFYSFYKTKCRQSASSTKNKDDFSLAEVSTFDVDNGEVKNMTVGNIELSVSSSPSNEQEFEAVMNENEIEDQS